MNKMSAMDETASEAQSLTALKRIKILSIVLGFMMFVFGFLKFFSPFSEWFHTQITNSGLPLVSIPSGMFTEMLVGLMLVIPWLSDRFSVQRRRQITLLASLIIIPQMLVATYVHLHPNVPAGVLPLGIKPPFIPLTFLILAALNGFFSFKLPGEDKFLSLSLKAS